MQKPLALRKHREITLFVLGFTEQENLPQHPTSSHLSLSLRGQEQKNKPTCRSPIK